MSDLLALILRLNKWIRIMIGNYYFLPIFLIVIFTQVLPSNGDGPNCMQKGSGPQDLYKNGVMNDRYSWYRSGNKIQVPVVLDSLYSYRERNVILGGLREIQEKTCVDFYVYNHTGYLQNYDYVYITKAKEGCWSHVGRVGGGQQELSLARGCINHRTAVHEMIHALGFTHEHVRSDRDKYVRIHWGNIQQGRERNFVKRTARGRDPYGPYDYGSIMHYDRRAFSLNGEDTIQPLKQPGAKIGLGQTMSYWDTKRILHMYKCGDEYGGGGYGGFSGGTNYVDDDDDERNPIQDTGLTGHQNLQEQYQYQPRHNHNHNHYQNQNHERTPNSQVHHAEFSSNPYSFRFNDENENHGNSNNPRGHNPYNINLHQPESYSNPRQQEEQQDSPIYDSNRNRSPGPPPVNDYGRNFLDFDFDYYDHRY